MKYVGAITIFLTTSAVSAAWEYNIHEDPFNGNTKYAMVFSYDKEAMLIVREDGGVIIGASNEYFCADKDDEVNMKYIIDGKQNSDPRPRGAYIKVATSGDAVYPSMGIRHFTRELIDGNELLVRISDRCGDIVDYKFDISGNPVKEWQ